ncbi:MULTISPECIES: glycosyltransferase [Clostridium]|uniref:glycosyltransferase n=1 Tax=Clostridium TaxID=1485 RepID=UPI000826E8F5|nr:MULTISPECIES: glycosyltransferase [Clostridium]PJI10473.1 glycosyl transferase [Clostridium sp. CT7]
MKIRKKFSSAYKPGVTIITVTNKAKFKKNIKENFVRCKYPEVEFIIILNSNKLNIKEYKSYFSILPNIKIYKLNEDISLGESMNFGIENSNYDYISKMDDDDYYGENYIGDLMNIFNYTSADIVGKASHFIYFEENESLNLWCGGNDSCYSKAVAGATLVMKKYIFDKVKFNRLNSGEDLDLIAQCNSLDFKIYSGDIFNYVYNRHKRIKYHSWKVSNLNLMLRSQKICRTNNYKQIVSM